MDEFERDGEPTSTDGSFERSVLLRLDELDRKLERVLQIACPVCGPDLIRQIHPEATYHDGQLGEALATLARATNGEHGG